MHGERPAPDRLPTPPSSNVPDHDASRAIILTLIYDELRQVAAGYLRHERAGHTLQPTALVNEAWARVQASQVQPMDHSAYCAAAAVAMRRILVEHARRKKAAKRGSGEQVGDVADLTLVDDSGRREFEEDLECVDSALRRLAEVDERAARIVELRFFGGLTAARVAEVLALSPRTIDSEWQWARAWLKADLLREHTTHGRA